MNKHAFYTCYDEHYVSNDDLEKINKKKKRVDFSVFRDVIILPKISETCDSIDIWWSTTDRVNACKSMTLEIHDLQKKYPDMTYKQAVKLLYQPNNICYYENKNYAT
jgi:hypothetical protein